MDKKVPTGAGLGGGSGNAATALWAANRLTGDLVVEKELQTWSAEIGSDVPFFFSKGSAYCTGRGEVMKPWMHWSVVLHVLESDGSFVGADRRRCAIIAPGFAFGSCEAQRGVLNSRGLQGIPHKMMYSTKTLQ